MPVEDYEIDESAEYSNHARDWAMPKIFRFDQLETAKPGIVKEAPYSFWGLATREPGWKWLDSTDAWVKDKPDDDMATKLLDLRRPMRFYLCGCITYCNSGGTDINCHCTTFAGPPHLRTEPGYGELRKGEKIIRVLIHLNKLQGRISTQNWRLSCWNDLSPKLRAAWEMEREQEEKQKQQNYFDRNSFINEDGEKELKVATRGRPKSDAVEALSDDDQSERKKLILRHAQYASLLRKGHRNLTEDNAQQMARTILGYTYHLNEIFEMMEQLGGAPTSWEYYTNEAEEESE